MNPTYVCGECGTEISGTDMDAFVAALAEHGRGVHSWPFPDMAIRNFAEATQRATGPTERADSIGSVEVHRVTPERIDDWLTFFDRDAFADNFAWASCYCAEPYLLGNPDVEQREYHWTEKRSMMDEWLRDGRAAGYLAYVDSKAGGWVNATLRRDYSRWRLGVDAAPPDADVLAIACFQIAPPYRRHGLAGRLLDAVIADAPGRGAKFVEAYPRPEVAANHEYGLSAEAMSYHGPYELFARRGFEPVGEREDGKFTAVRLAL